MDASDMSREGKVPESSPVGSAAAESRVPGSSTIESQTRGSTVAEQLEKEGFAVICGVGNSMRPLLRPAKDQVLIEKQEGMPKKNDVVFYRRPDGTNVLHRVVGFADGDCVVRGDHTFYKERIRPDAVAGTAKVIWRGKRKIQVTDVSYRLWVGLWNFLYPLRFLKQKAAGGLRRAARLIPEDTAPGWILRRAGSSLGAVAVLTFCTCLNAVLSVYTALVMREAIDSAVGLDRNGFLRWAAIFLAIVLTELAANALIRQLEEHVKASVENRLKRHAYDGILHSAYGSLKAFHTGELLNRLTNDTKVVADQVALLIPGFAAMVVRLAGALAVLIVIDWRFGSLFLAGGLVLAVTTLLFRKRLKTMHKSMQEADGQLRAWLTESVESVQILKSFEAEEMAEDRMETLAGAHKHERMRRATFSNLCNIGFGAIMQGSYLFGFVWCGMGILRGTLTYGTLTAVLSLVSQIRGPLANISGYVPRYYAMAASAERLMELEQLPEEERAGGALPEFCELCAEHLSFAYDDGEEVIRDASFTVRRGEIVALTGRSGIGKSTLLKLLLGIYRPTAGKLYGEERGNEKMEIGPATREWFSYVPQGNMLLSGSIYEAVDFLHTAPYTRSQKDRVEEACRIACADEFIRMLPEGYDTVLGEKGSGLSEGQMQRIAIARAIYRNAPVLLLDEATSALDAETEKRVLQNLKARANQTVLVVTHRPAALEICTKMLQFEKTGIREDGNEAYGWKDRQQKG